jgi:ABC-type glycerol-3-phosphate transport system substrate-binding protein
MLAMRIMGQEGMAATAAGDNGGFNNADWIKAGEEFKRLIDLKPLQDGFMGVKYDQATGLWEDGKALFHLMGDWDLGAQRGAASSGGLSNDQLGLIRFPMVEGGKGKITDTSAVPPASYCPRMLRMKALSSFTISLARRCRKRRPIWVSTYPRHLRQLPM